jgi:hypothetical protein
MSPNAIQVKKSRRMSWTGHLVHIREWRGAYRVLVGRLEGNRQLGRLRHRWEDNITVIIKYTGWDGMHGVHLTVSTIPHSSLLYGDFSYILVIGHLFALSFLCNYFQTSHLHIVLYTQLLFSLVQYLVQHSQN